MGQFEWKCRVTLNSKEPYTTSYIAHKQSPITMDPECGNLNCKFSPAICHSGHTLAHCHEWNLSKTEVHFVDRPLYFPQRSKIGCFIWTWFSSLVILEVMGGICPVLGFKSRLCHFLVHDWEQLAWFPLAFVFFSVKLGLYCLLHHVTLKITYLTHVKHFQSA